MGSRREGQCFFLNYGHRTGVGEDQTVSERGIPVAVLAEARSK